MVFVEEGLKVLEDVGSDHRPVLLEFNRHPEFSLQEVENLQKSDWQFESLPIRCPVPRTG